MQARIAPAHRTRLRAFGIALAVVVAMAVDGDVLSGAAAPRPTASASQPATVVLGGVVREAGSMKLVAGVRLIVTSGPDAGAVAVSDDQGAFTFARLTPGVIDLEGTKDGYRAALVQSLSVQQDAAIEFPISRTAPPAR
jgi:hypothetical protein